jgi:hypothetical protein
LTRTGILSALKILEGFNNSEVTGFDRFDEPSKLKRVRRIHLFEEVERTKMSGDVRG